MRLFYDPHIKQESTLHYLNEEESKHIIRVLRMMPKDWIGILDGNGGFYQCEIADNNPKKCGLRIISSDRQSESTQQIHVAIAPTKQLERIEWFVEKATEIGITDISLINCDNSERSQVKIDRLVKKAIAAMKQSQIRFLPNINPIKDVQIFIEENPTGILAHCYEEKREKFEEVYKSTSCPMLIGPEGDFTREEIEFALKNGYKSVSLGENRLRTETAGLYACMRAKMMTE